MCFSAACRKGKAWGLQDKAVSLLLLAAAGVTFAAGPLLLLVSQPFITVAALGLFLTAIWSWAVLWGLVGFAVCLAIIIPPVIILGAIGIPIFVVINSIWVVTTPLVWYLGAPLAYLAIGSYRAELEASPAYKALTGFVTPLSCLWSTKGVSKVTSEACRGE